MDGIWNLGESDYHLVLGLRDLCVGVPIHGVDKIVWDNNPLPLNISVIYSSIATNKASPLWFPFIWHKLQVPRYGFTAWLILQEKLLTRDRMLSFQMVTPLLCVLCLQHNESHEHIFCDCPFSRVVLDVYPSTPY